MARGLKRAAPIFLHVGQQLLSGLVGPDLVKDQIANPDADDKKTKDLSPERVTREVSKGRVESKQEKSGQDRKDIQEPLDDPKDVKGTGAQRHIGKDKVTSRAPWIISDTSPSRSRGPSPAYLENSW